MTDPQSIDEAWQRLTTHIAWSDAFWLVYLFTDDPRVNDELRDRVKTQLLPVGREVIHLRPSGDADDTSVLERLLAGQEGAVAWVDLVRHDRPGETKWRDAWELLCAQLNMRRELLKRRWAGGGIVLATTLDRLDRSAAAAPDLWTIRALLLRVATLPAEPGDGWEVRLLEDERDESGPTGDPELARQAVARARKRGDQLALLETLVGLAEATEGDEARAAADEGRAIGGELLAKADRSTQLKIAGWWTRLGRVLVRLGACDEAKACFEQSIELFEQVHGTRTRPEIAEALLGLAEALVDGMRAAAYPVDRQQQALELTAEAVEIHRAWLTAQPDAATADLANALRQRAKRLLELGRFEDGEAASREAVELFRKLACGDPVGYSSDLGKALTDLGVALNRLGQREDSVAATQKAVELFRKLAGAQPDARLARALRNLGGELQLLGRWEDSLAATQESVDILRSLPSANPDDDRRQFLARSLEQLGTILRQAGAHDDALNATQEAVDILRDLVDTNSERILPDLAAALDNLSVHLNEVGRRDAGLAAVQQAVDVYRELARTNPDVFLSRLAHALGNLGSDLNNMGRWEHALAPLQEAVDIYRKVARANPDAFVPDLAHALDNLGVPTSRRGRHLLARDLWAEALSVILPYFVKHPRAHRRTAASAANHLHRVQQHGAAIPDALVPIVDYFVHHDASTPPTWSEADLQRAFEFVPPYAQHPPPSPEPTEPVAEVTETAPSSENLALRWALIIGTFVLIIALAVLLT